MSDERTFTKKEVVKLMIHCFFVGVCGSEASALGRPPEETIAEAYTMAFGGDHSEGVNVGLACCVKSVIDFHDLIADAASAKTN